MRQGHLISDDRSHIWNLHKTLTFHKVV